MDWWFVNMVSNIFPILIKKIITCNQKGFFFTDFDCFWGNGIFWAPFLMNSLWDWCSQLYSIRRNVRFILGPMGFEVFGIWCFQKCWVVPFINNKLPCSSKMFCFKSGIELCFNWKILSAPKLTEAIIGLVPNSFSLSACQPLPSFPSRYKLSKTVVKFVLETISTLDFIFYKSGFQGCGSILMFE